jgi:uncharacterized delta-60 repeat protein
MWKRLLFIVASLIGALLSSAVGVGAGPPVGVVQVEAPSEVEGRAVAYGFSQLLLIRPASSDSSGVTRINLDGSVDRSFGNEGTVGIPAEDAAVTRDGKILVSTSSRAAGGGGDSDARVTRLLPDGQLDSSFGVVGSADVDFGSRYDAGESVALAANGKILLAGQRQTYAVGRGEIYLSPAVVRLRPNGSLDRSFGKKGVRLLAGGGENAALDVAPTPDGGVVVEVGNEIEAALWKLTRGGSVDADFGKRGLLEVRGRREKYGYHEELFMVPRIAVLPSGKLLLAATGFPDRGPDDWVRVVAVRLHPDGRVDRSYGHDGWATTSRGRRHAFAEGLALLPGGVLVIATTFDSPPDERRRFGAIAFGPDGRLERRFGKRGRCGAGLVGEHEALGIVTAGRRSVVVGHGGGHQWLLNCRPLRGR